MNNENRFWRKKKLRFEQWNYSGRGDYFITCTVNDRQPVFGKLIAGKVEHTTAGAIVLEIMNLIPEKFPFVKLDELVVMPDHVHFILFVGSQSEEKIYSLSEIVRWFKGRSTYELRKLKIEFSWQPNYYDRVIRSSQELENIRRYIIENPRNAKPR
jgi:REP element-mobilizing transposase RayT